jgi:hypothetical protein
VAKLEALIQGSMMKSVRESELTSLKLQARVNAVVDMLPEYRAIECAADARLARERSVACASSHPILIALYPTLHPRRPQEDVLETADEYDIANLYSFCVERTIDAASRPRPLDALKGVAFGSCALIALTSMQLTCTSRYSIRPTAQRAEVTSRRVRSSGLTELAQA